MKSIMELILAIYGFKKIKIDLMKDNSDMYQIAKDELYKLFKKIILKFLIKR